MNAKFGQHMPFGESKQKPLDARIMGRRDETFKHRDGTLQWDLLSAASLHGIAGNLPGEPAQKTVLVAGSCLQHLEGNSE